jgi:hypothetical protein
MAVIYYFDVDTDSWKPITTGSGGGTPGPKGDKGDKGDAGESIEVVVQNTQPASAKPGTVWISNT